MYKQIIFFVLIQKTLIKTITLNEYSVNITGRTFVNTLREPYLNISQSSENVSC